MSTVIKNGTVVTADLSYKADVLVEGGKIVQIGADLVTDRGRLDPRDIACRITHARDGRLIGPEGARGLDRHADVHTGHVRFAIDLAMACQGNRGLGLDAVHGVSHRV